MIIFVFLASIFSVFSETKGMTRAETLYPTTTCPYNNVFQAIKDPGNNILGFEQDIKTFTSNMRSLLEQDTTSLLLGNFSQITEQLKIQLSDHPATCSTSEHEKFAAPKKTFLLEKLDKYNFALKALERGADEHIDKYDQRITESLLQLSFQTSESGPMLFKIFSRLKKQRFDNVSPKIMLCLLLTSNYVQSTLYEKVGRILTSHPKMPSNTIYFNPEEEAFYTARKNAACSIFATALLAFACLKVLHTNILSYPIMTGGIGLAAKYGIDACNAYYKSLLWSNKNIEKLKKILKATQPANNQLFFK